MILLFFGWALKVFDEMLYRVFVYFFVFRFFCVCVWGGGGGDFHVSLVLRL